MKKNNWVADGFAFLLPLLFIAFVYSGIFFHPSEHMFNIEGDGIKNYYTLAWYVQNNSDWLHHSAMKYPYGEHYLYTDGFVPFGWLFKLIGLNGVSAIGFVNFLMIFSLVLTAFFAHKILQYFQVNPWVSILGGFAIAILTPQLPRLTGHYALGLSFFLVFSTWLYLLYLKNPSWKLTTILFFNSIFWLFIHPYLGIMVVLFYSLIWIYKLLFEREKKEPIHYLMIFVQTLLPVIVFKLFLVITDTHQMRPSKPWGFWIFMSNYKSFLVPSTGPFAELAKKIVSIEKVSWETYAYIGVFAITIVVVYLIRLILGKEKSKASTSKTMRTLIFSAMVIAVISMGVPFIWYPKLADVLSSIRNFRALGRFAWVFYYMITIFAMYKFDQWIFKAKTIRVVYKRVFAVVFIGIMIFEGVGTHLTMAQKIQKKPNYFDYANLDKDMQAAISQVNADEFRAILPLPYYHIGTYGIKPVPDALFTSMIFSYHTGLPLFSNDLPRTSIIENKKSIMVVAPNNYPKPIFDDMPAEGKVLLFQIKGNLTSEEQEILKKAELLNSTKKYQLAKISISDLNTKQEEEIINKDSLLTLGKGLHAFGNNRVEFESYTNEEGGGRMFGKEYNLLLDFTKKKTLKPGKYKFSLWYKNRFNDRPSAAIFLETKKNGEEKKHWKYYTLVGNKVLIAADSIRFQLDFTLDSLTEAKLFFNNPNREVPRLHILNWMLRGEETSVFLIENDSISVNNHIKQPFN